MGVFRWFGDAVRRRVEDAVGSAMDSVGKAAVLEARRLVPVDTGQTRDSIGFTWSRSRLVLTLHADTSWAIFLELGTRHMAARPFLRPAVLSTAGLFGRRSEVQFARAPEKYRAGYRAATRHARRPSVVIGHRSRH